MTLWRLRSQCALAKAEEETGYTTTITVTTITTTRTTRTTTTAPSVYDIRAPTYQTNSPISNTPANHLKVVRQTVRHHLIALYRIASYHTVINLVFALRTTSVSFRPHLDGVHFKRPVWPRTFSYWHGVWRGCFPSWSSTRSYMTHHNVIIVIITTTTVTWFPSMENRD